MTREGVPVAPPGETSRPLELTLAVDRDLPRTLPEQIEDQVREAVRRGELHPGARVPSTRDLARQLTVSRRVVVEAYTQLAAEGYLSMRQGSFPAIADGVAAVAAAGGPAPRLETAVAPRYDFRPSRPDVSVFPRGAWARALRDAVGHIADAELIYGDPCGVEPLRNQLADYLGRVRGVVAPPAQVVVTSGYLQALGLVCRALAERGVRRVALEDPSAPEQRPIARRAGLEPVPVPVDENGLRVDALEGADVGAVVCTPAHQHPMGGVLHAERRTALVRWLRATGAFAIEDDYDAEHRYDRTAVKALQGIAPDRVVYAGSASKTLAPALRLGWLAVPAELLDAVAEEKLLADQGTARIEQHAFARFVERGELDRHLRRMRIRYRARRDATLAALAEVMPDARVEGIEAGLHLTVRLPGRYDEAVLRAAAGRRRVLVSLLSDYRPGAFDADPVLLVGYAQVPEAGVRAGLRELAGAVEEARLGARPRP
jgi:GntR family transcriptional regulator/MocR family aminotransferase